MTEQAEQCHLFVFPEYYPNGGASDHVYTGTMSECMGKVEALEEACIFQIARTGCLSIVKEGEYSYEGTPTSCVGGALKIEWHEIP